MERALLQGERQAELDQIEAETDIITQLQRKLDELESTIQREKDKVQRAVGIYSTAHVLNALFESTNYIQVYRIQIFAEVVYILREERKHTHIHSLPVLLQSPKQSSLVSYIPYWYVTVGVFT